MTFCDLHAHSLFSDGTDTPETLIRQADALGLSHLTLCDHNTVAGLPDFLAAARSARVKAVAGAEFSVNYEGSELHLLGLFIPEERFAEVDELMTREVLSRKEACNREMIASLCRAGYALDYDEICRAFPQARVNRAHIATVMAERGYVSSVAEAFDTLLSKSGPHYREPQRPDVFDMIAYIRKIGAVPVLAHPHLSLSPDRLTAFLPRAKAQGLIGMECYYSTFTEEETALALSLTKENGLLPSGGSDYHGKTKPDIALGVGHGNLRIPTEWAEALAAQRA